MCRGSCMDHRHRPTDWTVLDNLALVVPCSAVSHGLSLHKWECNSCLICPGAELRDWEQKLQLSKERGQISGQVRIKGSANADYSLAPSKRYQQSQMTRQARPFTGLEPFKVWSGVYTLKWTCARDQAFCSFDWLRRRVSLEHHTPGQVDGDTYIVYTKRMLSPLGRSDAYNCRKQQDLTCAQRAPKDDIFTAKHRPCPAAGSPRL